MGGSHRFCGRCGRELKQGASFCGSCGFSFLGSSSRAAANDSVEEPRAGPAQASDLAPGCIPTITTWAVSPVPARPAAANDRRGGTGHPSAARGPISGQGSPPPGMAPGGRPPLRPPDRRARRPARFRWLLVIALALVVVGGGAAAGLILARHSHSQPVAARYKIPTASSTASSASQSSQPGRQQAAQSLSALLSQSVADRSSIVNAVSDVNQCGPSLSQDQQTFNSANASRQTLLSQLANLPGQSELPAPMLQALTSAWQASAQADQDFAQWAGDESQGCIQNDHSNSNYQAATGPDSRATTGKRTFASLWNPIASEYGLATYQWDQL